MWYFKRVLVLTGLCDGSTWGCPPSRGQDSSTALCSEHEHLDNVIESLILHLEFGLENHVHQFLIVRFTCSYHLRR